jgi:hypothetical protein
MRLARVSANRYAWCGLAEPNTVTILARSPRCRRAGPAASPPATPRSPGTTAAGGRIRSFSCAAGDAREGIRLVPGCLSAGGPWRPPSPGEALRPRPGFAEGGCAVLTALGDGSPASSSGRRPSSSALGSRACRPTALTPAPGPTGQAERLQTRPQRGLRHPRRTAMTDSGDQSVPPSAAASVRSDRCRSPSGQPAALAGHLQSATWRRSRQSAMRHSDRVRAGADQAAVCSRAGSSRR